MCGAVGHMMHEQTGWGGTPEQTDGPCCMHRPGVCTRGKHRQYMGSKSSQGVHTEGRAEFSLKGGGGRGGLGGAGGGPPPGDPEL